MSKYHRIFHVNPTFKQKISTVQNKLKQVCCNCIVLPVSAPPPPKKGYLYIKVKVLELPCESIFLVKACEGQPLEKIDLEKKMLLVLLEKKTQKKYNIYELKIKWNDTCWCRFHENALIIVHNMQYISSYGCIIFTCSDFALAVALLRPSMHQTLSGETIEMATAPCLSQVWKEGVMTFSRQFIVRRNTRYTDIQEHVDLKRFCVLYRWMNLLLMYFNVLQSLD